MMLALWVLAAFVGCFGLGAVLGAPYLPILRKERDIILDFADVKAGETVLDLGSGDGTLLLAAAARGATAIGYEINPVLVVWSRIRCWRYRRQITIRLGDFWRAELPSADIIYVFLIDRYTAKLHAKLTAELSRPTRVVSYVFELPKKSVKTNRNSFLYRYP